MGRVFGTDGVRGRVGKPPMTVDFAVRLASAAGRVLAPSGGRAVVGKDPRISGYMFESALEAGFVAAGVDVALLSVMPTPGIAYLTRELGADIGVVISASHNPYHDNGIKIFGPGGTKLNDDVEAQIEEALGDEVLTLRSSRLGRAERLYDAASRYQTFCRGSVPEDFDLSGIHIVIDCANGATFKVAPRVFADLGADVVTIGCSPNGKNINEDSGSTAPARLQRTVSALGAELGIAFDGDGDRLLMVDGDGQLVDGDQIVHIIAQARKSAGTLRGPVVGTLMSNLGLELALQAEGISFERVQVGDRYVLERLRERDGIVGGETSGHVLCLDRTTTGDGIITALQVLAAMREADASLASLARRFDKFPQVLINVRLEERCDLATLPQLDEAVAEVEAELGQRGRVVLRASGTEPVIRVMVEGEDEVQVRRLAERLAAQVTRLAGAV